MVKLDDGRVLRLSPRTAEENALKVGMSLDSEDIERLSVGGGRHIRDAAAALLSGRELTEGQLRDRLSERGYDGESIDGLIEDFTRWGLIDDRRYCELLAAYCSRKNMSRRAMENELYKRKVPRELWAEALEMLKPAADAIEELLEARLKGRGADPSAIDSAMRYLCGRGFDSREVRNALRNYREDLGEDDQL